MNKNILCFASLIFAPLGIYLIFKFRKNYSFKTKICIVLVSFLCSCIIIFGLFIILNENLYLKSNIFKLQKTISTINKNSDSSKNFQKQDKNSKIEKKENSNTSSNQNEIKDIKNTDKKPTKEKKKDLDSSLENKKENSKIVYITKSGKKYHYSNSCSKGNFTAISIKDAIEKGYEPCKKCVKK